jgi:hypothetical protein
MHRVYRPDAIDQPNPDADVADLLELVARLRQEHERRTESEGIAATNAALARWNVPHRLPRPRAAS